MQTSLDHHTSSAAASARVRELARRRSGADDVLLVWHPDGDRIELSVLDATTGEGFHLQVEPDRALDAFNHPFAYVAWRESAGDAGLGETAISVDDAGA
jgi:hypothetical protein